MDERDVETIRAGYDAFNAGDVERLAQLALPEFEWHEAREVPGRRVCRNRDEFVDYLRGYALLWERFSFEPLRFEGDGGVLLAEVTARGRGRASGEEVELRVFHVWRVRGGRAARMDAFFDEREAREAAGLPDEI